MVLQKHRAQKLWFSHDEAKAIGIAEATKYAIFKNIRLSWGTRTNKDEVVLASPQKLKQMVSDETKYQIFWLKAKDNKPFVGNRIFTSQDYDNYLKLRFDSQTIKLLDDWAKNIIDKTPIQILENEQKFFSKVWKVHRDDEL